MKTKPFAAFSLVVALASGCSPSGDKSPQAETSTTPQAERGTPASKPPSLETVKKETADAANAVQSYTFAQKDKFLDAMRSKLDAASRELDRLGDKAGKAEGDLKTDAEGKLKPLREKVGDLRVKLDQAKDATEAGWDDIKTGFKKVQADFDDALERTKQWWAEKFRG